MVTARVVTVDMEAWIDGSLVGGSRRYGWTVEEIRNRECPVREGWKHVVDEGFLAAIKGNRLYLFRVI
jgi:hypothetical protein